MTDDILEIFNEISLDTGSSNFSDIQQNNKIEFEQTEKTVKI